MLNIFPGLKNKLKDPEPLPTGVIEFEAWSDRIISVSGLTATPESQKFALASMIVRLPESEGHKEDEFFIGCLRKSAATQVAQHIMKEIKEDRQKRVVEEMKNKTSADTAQIAVSNEVLSNPTV